MKAAAATFVADYKLKKQPRWLSLLGTSGAGKTLLAKFIRDATQQRWESQPSGVKYSTYWSFYHWPTAAKRMLDRRQWDLVDCMIEDDCCIIDEVECESDSKGILRDKLCNIAERRLGKWTVITSNLSLEGIAAKLDQRISSRMLRGGNVVVDVDVLDYNLRKRNER